MSHEQYWNFNIKIEFHAMSWLVNIHRFRTIHNMYLYFKQVNVYWPLYHMGNIEIIVKTQSSMLYFGQ